MSRAADGNKGGRRATNPPPPAANAAAQFNGAEAAAPLVKHTA